jgi:hypothetical protein
MFTGGLNTIIIFFWVNNKLSETSVYKHSNLFRISFIYMIIYYGLYIALKFFPMNKSGKIRKFILCPDYKDESLPQEEYLYYLTLVEIILNILNQVFMLNFYFLVIKNLIIRTWVSFYFKRKK